MGLFCSLRILSFHSLSITLFDPPRLRRLRASLSRWYARHGRDLPWRANRDPYRIWISEAMLQQTTVVAVKPYFERFLARFPTVQALAEAPIDDVLRQWEGLGYYSRARNLHRAAKVISGEREGQFPREVAALQELPGVGRYTAGAIASFAFDVRAPIVEANTLRLYSRLLGYEGDPRSREGQALLWEFAEKILPLNAAGAFNHAAMDLGAMICRPTDPDCPNCPLKSCCQAFTEGTQDRIPQRAKRPELTDVVDATVVIRSGDSVLIRQRGEDERWAGLWDFPRVTIDSGEQGALRPDSKEDLERLARSTLGDWVRQNLAFALKDWTLVTEIRHGVTRYRIRLLCFTAVVEPSRGKKLPAGVRWVTPAELADVPLSMTGRKLAGFLK